jgi:trans-aconitate methyltransferase
MHSHLLISLLAIHANHRYFNLLSPLVKDIDMWTTEYVQQLPAAAPTAAEAHETSAARHPVLEYTKATGLLPIIEALGGEGTANCQTYLGEYDRLLHEAYPIVKVQNKHMPNGRHITIMPFKRFFMVCKL